MPTRPSSHEGRLRRLAEELADEGFAADGPWSRRLLEELDYARHPAVFERRVPSYGALVGPSIEPEAWAGPTQLDIVTRPVRDIPLVDARRFADGLSSWLVHPHDAATHDAGPDDAAHDTVHAVGRDDGDGHRPGDGGLSLSVFDRAAGSERDLVILAAATGATVVQRHPSGLVRAVGKLGVIRWDGLDWHHEPPIRSWLDDFDRCAPAGDRALLEAVLDFAVHDLGARGIGALLVLGPRIEDPDRRELRLPPPPPLRIDRPSDLAPLRHALAQVDGAAVFDTHGTLRQLGVRLVPSPAAEGNVEGFRGMRHTSARRYSFDDPDATVIVVSEDGPVTVLRNGKLVGRSDPT